MLRYCVANRAYIDDTQRTDRHTDAHTATAAAAATDSAVLRAVIGSAFAAPPGLFSAIPPLPQIPIHSGAAPTAADITASAGAATSEIDGTPDFADFNLRELDTLSFGSDDGLGLEIQAAALQAHVVAAAAAGDDAAVFERLFGSAAQESNFRVLL